MRVRLAGCERFAQALISSRICQRRFDLHLSGLTELCDCSAAAARSRAQRPCSAATLRSHSALWSRATAPPAAKATRAAHKASWRQRVEPTLTWDCTLTAVTSVQGQDASGEDDAEGLRWQWAVLTAKEGANMGGSVTAQVRLLQYTLPLVPHQRRNPFILSLCSTAELPSRASEASSDAAP